MRIRYQIFRRKSNSHVPILMTRVRIGRVLATQPPTPEMWFAVYPYREDRGPWFNSAYFMSRKQKSTQLCILPELNQDMNYKSYMKLKPRFGKYLKDFMDVGGVRLVTALRRPLTRRPRQNCCSRLQVASSRMAQQAPGSLNPPVGFKRRQNNVFKQCLFTSPKTATQNLFPVMTNQKSRGLHPLIKYHSISAYEDTLFMPVGRALSAKTGKIYM